jgi:hypothetical protein
MNIDTFTRLDEADMNHVFKIIEQVLGGMV